MSISGHIAEALDAGLNLTEVFAAGAARGKRGMHFLERDGAVRDLPYATLHSDGQRIAVQLAGHRVRAGDPVLLCCDDEYRLVQMFWAVLLAGGVVVPLSAPRSYSTDDEAIRKLAAVAVQCAAASGDAPLLITDLDPDGLRKSSLADCVRTVDAASLLAAAHTGERTGAPLPRRTQESLAMLMYSSGSTGDAKGVRLTHGELLHNLRQISDRSALQADDRSLSWLPLTHDMGLVLFHVCHVIAGIEQYKMTPLAFARDPAAFLDAVEALGITVTGMPNFGFDQLLRIAEGSGPGGSLGSLRLIYNGAEPIDPDLCRRFMKRMREFGLAEGVISPGWGIAEACVVATQFPQAELAGKSALPSLWLDAASPMAPGDPVMLRTPHAPGAREILSLGPLMQGMQIRCLDDNGAALADAHLGHLEIRGPNVSAGYFGKPDSEWCSTGDIGFVHEGCVFLTGRAKDVLFINGRNHFSNDLELALSRALDWPAEQVAIVGVTDPRRMRDRVVVFFRQGSKTQRDSQAELLRTTLERLLAYPVAGAIGLSSLPKTTSGKLRRYALRQALERGEFDSQLDRPETASSRPLSADENQLLTSLREVLPHLPEAIDPELPLSRYGLDSVGHAQLAFRLSARLGRPVPPQALLAAASLAAIAAKLAAADLQPGTPATIFGNKVPLTGRQQMLWTAWLLEPEQTKYNENYTLPLRGKLDSARWCTAAHTVVRSHPMLNAVVDDADEPVLVLRDHIAPDIESVALDPVSASAFIAKLAATPFNLRRGPLLRLRLIRHPDDSHTLFLSAHHLVVDGWSLHLLVSQIFAAASGRSLPEPQRKLWFQPAGLEPEPLQLWSQKLATAEVLQLPSDTPHAAAGACHEHRFDLPAATAQALKNWCARHGGSEFTVLAASIAVVLGRLAQVRHPLLGTVFSGRHDPGAEHRVGYFATTLPLLVDLAPERSFLAVVNELDQLRPAMLGGQLPDLSTLAATAGLAVAGRLRLVYVHQNMPPLQLPAGIDCGAPGQIRGEARTDLYISSTWHGERLELVWEYDSARFGADQIAGYAELYRYALEGLLNAPERPLGALDLLSPAQRALWQRYQGAQRPLDRNHHVVTRFEASALAHPQRQAVSDSVSRLSYAGLRERIDALCWKIDASGPQPGERVCLMTARSADYVIALLATLKLGLVAVPIDPALPEERIRAIVADSEPALLLTTPGIVLPASLQAELPTLSFTAVALPATRPHPGHPPALDEVAYLIFTSGSTGRPKGVPIAHRSLANLVDWVIGDFGYQAGETICQFAPFSFDVSMAEILPSLCAGLHLHLLSDERRASPALYLETIERQAVRIATLTPAYLAVLNETPERCSAALRSLRLLIMGGEALRTEEVNRFRRHSPHVRIVNVYGPTETTVLSTAYPVPDSPDPRSVWQPLGLPIANTEVWLLDEQGQVCPATVTGTLHIGGAGLSDGYWRDPAKTGTAFRFHSPDRLASRILYCTGDLARLSATGMLEFVGRADNQVKLRGFRIELGDIESTLEMHPEIDTAVVKVLPREGGERSLVAYYTGTQQARSGLERFVAERLPAYMVPSHYQHLDAWPMTPNRKIDRNKLPEPERDNAGAGRADAPVGATETALAAIWCALLGLEAVERDSHFFLLGGSSLTAAQLVNRIRDRFGRDLRLITVMQHPTLSELAALIDETGATDDDGPRAGMSAHDDVGLATDAQARMYVLERSHPDRAVNNMPLSLVLAAALDPVRLEAALGMLVARHPELKMRFQLEARGLSIRFDAPEPRSIQLEVETEEQAILALERFHTERFDLDRGPLLRIALVSAQAANRHWLALCFHHAVADGVSLSFLLGELESLYRGEPLPDSGKRVSYLDYAAWLRNRIEGEFGTRARAFWLRPEYPSPLPHLPERPGRADGAGRQFMVTLDARQSGVLQTFCKRHAVSPFVLGLSLFGFLIGQRCDIERFTLGVTFSGRTHGALDRVPGLFVNTLPLAFDWQPDERFPVLLERTRARLAELQEVQDFPLNQVMALRNQRDTPFNILFNEEVVPADLSFGGHAATLFPVSTRSAKFPLVVSFLFSPTSWRWRMEHSDPGLPAEWVNGLVREIRQSIDSLAEMGEGRIAELIAPDRDLLAMLDTD